jgi:ankyrin repeat protein
MTVTHFALLARKNAPKVMAAVLKAGADPVSMLSSGDNVPQYAVGRDNADPEVVRVLLESGIDPNWFPPSGHGRETSLLQSAVRGHNLPVIKLLVAKGADINYVNPIMGSALHYALNGSDFFMAAFLVEAGIDLSLKDSTSPKITNNRSRPMTAIEAFCRFEGGKRGANPLPRIAEGWRVFTAALARRGVTMPCNL